MSDLPTSIERESRSRKKWPWLVAAAIVVVVAVVVSWVLLGRGADSAPASAAAAGDGEPVSGGTLQFGMIDYQRSPDPQLGTNYAESIIGNNVTDKLTWQDPDTGEITPWLAESWEVNDDLTEFTFHLRDDVTFSDGTPFDAEVVKANYDQYVRGDDALGIKPNGAVLFTGYIETVVDDEFTATIRFENPIASFLQATSFTANAQPGFLSLSTLAKSAEERTDAKNVIGTGPFVYDEWVEQVRTVLVKREGYDWAPPALEHDGEAYLDKIVFNVIPEASVRTGSLRTGEIDATLDVGTTDEGPLTDEGFQIISRPVSGTAIFFNFNASLAPTNDIAVRRAIQLGWNRDAVEKTVLTDSYTVATSVLADSVPGYRDYSESLLHYDPDEAEAILDEAGWEVGDDGIRVKDGQRLQITLLGISNLVANKPAYESIQQDLQSIGIDLQLAVLPLADYAAAVANAATDYNVVAANRSRNDPAVLNLQYSPLIGNGNYLTEDFDGYDDLVTTLGKLELTLDPDERAEFAADAQDALLEEYALVNPVYNPSQVIAHAPTVHGIIFDAQSRNHFVDTWLSETP
ncbi:peptide/nickel transport system substrate-binding protein [Microbacterium terrae]|uniref:Nickel-binding periplasmic protein n=1 Tax=Microbacterium terrae TaxID=69369 RepID=A0A0M2HFB4_9MICO|nr:ABC transporter substrate-binding protein [Microbacterium terrae]KJL45334.1 Nickel-binding periplasmic protein precursor [Microbacterium terrae]MBP1078417.1 peptide/nickel transport system substrate-binding protein [Microbacterium terrae]GLJ99317.1 peptide ABC transporter substrate-binding protein [Microbacterium terrae]